MNPSDLSPDDRAKLVSKVATIARQAAIALRRPVTSISSDSNPSTNVDLEVSAFIKGALSRLINIPVLSEEDDFKFSFSTTSKWIVDPIDGTLNLLSESPDVAISIALVDDHQLAQVAVVFLPFHEQLFAAHRNGGSFLNGHRLRSKAKTKIAAYGLPGNASAQHADLIRPIQRCIKNGYFLRQSGSAAVDICRVARGSWAAFFQRGLFIWDVAAADLIATEAGACSKTVTHEDGVTCDYVVVSDELETETFFKTINWSPK